MYFYNTELGRQLDSKLEIHKDQTLSEAVEMAWKVNVSSTDDHCMLLALLNTYAGEKAGKMASLVTSIEIILCWSEYG